MAQPRDLDISNYDPLDPDPALALFLDNSTPICPVVKKMWLLNSSSKSRQYILPFVRPIAKLFIILIQVLKALSPVDWRFSKFLHHTIAFGLKHFVQAEANHLILRHFHIGSEILTFIAKNVPGVQIELSPLRPKTLDDLKDDVFLKHDLNLYNFIIRLNKDLQEKDLEIKYVAKPDFSMITIGEFDIAPMKNGFFNVLDLETAIEIFTPVYQFFLTDSDFWRAAKSLQLDETVGIYLATIMNSKEHLVLVNNKHPMVPADIIQAGYRLVLHGLSSEMAHWLLTLKRIEQQNG